VRAFVSDRGLIVKVCAVANNPAEEAFKGSIQLALVFVVVDSALSDHLNSDKKCPGRFRRKAIDSTGDSELIIPPLPGLSRLH